MDLELRALERALQRAGRDVVVLDKSLATELAQQVSHFMGGKHYYVAYCHFCKQTLSLYRDGQRAVDHQPACVGVRLLKALESY
jgi:Mor family transcriptional regulator